MKKILLSLMLLCCMNAAWAQEITADESLQRALEQLIGKKGYAMKARGKADFALVHTEKGVGNGKALYYVFSNERNGGFVITGGDRRANPVLGHTDNGSFEQALCIPAFRCWLSSCEAAMQWLSDTEDSAVESNLPKFNIPDQVVTNADNTISVTIPGRNYAADPTLPASVEPLLGGIVWSQKEPYNGLCPEIEYNGEKQRCAAGCLATATAQVMKYWGWPKQGIGSHKYTSKGDVEVELEADFSQSVYDWDDMLDDYTGDYTDEQAYAVAKLMSDVGIAEDMEYGAQDSGTSFERAAYALATYFGYNMGMLNCGRYYYTYAEWNDLLKKELAQSRPVIFNGYNTLEDIAFALVLDGYDADGNYHVNWGFGGLFDGYFDINYMDPDYQGTDVSNGGFSAAQQIITNCFPDTDGTSVAHYQLIVRSEPSVPFDNTIACIITNNGLAPYSGQTGFIAMIDNEVVGKVVKDVEELGLLDSDILMVPFADLGITPELIGDKQCRVYPVYLEGEEYKVPLSQVSLQDYVLLSVDADGNIVSGTNPDDNASPICESIEITRDYAGYGIKGKAVITNEEGHPAFDRKIFMFVTDDDQEMVAAGHNYAFIDAGETCEIEFTCDSILTEIGKTYNVSLHYDARFQSMVIPGSETTVTIKDPGAEPNLSYSGFALDKTVIAPKDSITVSFDVENTGGFGIETFYVAVFKDDESQNLTAFKVEADLPTGTTTVTKTIGVNYEEGLYYIGVFTISSDGQKNKLTPEYLKFYIKNPTTAISNVTDNNNLSTHYYDLQGRCVANPTKGLYIKNGKKVAM